MKQILTILTIAFLVNVVYSQTEPIDYFGQTPPGKTVVKFAPAIISNSGLAAGSIVFSSDGNECYFMASFKIYYSIRTNQIWSKPAVAPFSANINAGFPFISADGTKLYFTRWSSDFSSINIWMVERASDSWGEPKLLPSPINVSSDGSYTEAFDGTAYIDSQRPGGLGYGDIWSIRTSSEGIKQAESLGSIVNSSYDEGSPFVARDGSYIVFYSLRPGFSNQDLFVSFNKGNGQWSEPINLEESGAGINLPGLNQVSPTLSPDGKYLFFGRHNDAGTQLGMYWVSTSIIDSLRSKITSVEKVGDIIPEEFQLNQNYPNPFNPSTIINFSLPFPSKGEGPGVRLVTLKVYDILGHEIATLVNDYKSPGSYEVEFDGTALSSGIYFYALKTENYTQTRKMLMIK